MSRILLVSDIHANLAALDAVLLDAESHGAPDRVWCLGDAVGYGPQPNECLKRLNELGALAVAGNHELAALGSLSIEEFNQQARAAAVWTTGLLTDESREYAGSLPRTTVSGDFTLVHGSPRDPVWEYLHNSDVAAVNLPFLETKHCVNGHTHVPVVLSALGHHNTVAPDQGQVVELQEGRMFVNPGSVGQPRDGDPRASYAMLDDDAETVTFFRVEYPIANTQALMRQAGLPEVLWRRLARGF
jgi:predicted phosphodiesterase